VRELTLAISAASSALTIATFFWQVAHHCISGFLPLRMISVRSVSIVISVRLRLLTASLSNVRRRAPVPPALARNPNSPFVKSFWALLLALKARFREAESELPAILEAGKKFRVTHHITYNFAAIFALQGKEHPFLDRIRKTPEFVQFMTELKLRWEGYQREFQ
jgi:hypothetical protein